MSLPFAMTSASNTLVESDALSRFVQEGCQLRGDFHESIEQRPDLIERLNQISSVNDPSSPRSVKRFSNEAKPRPSLSKQLLPAQPLTRGGGFVAPDEEHPRRARSRPPAARPPAARPPEPVRVPASLQRDRRAQGHDSRDLPSPLVESHQQPQAATARLHPL
jgi:hypothetical protein